MTRHKSHDERREEILEAAKRCFLREGYQRTRMDDVAREAGLSKGGVYFHFPSKRDIFDALHGAEIDRNMALIAQLDDVEASLAEQLTRLASNLVAYFGGNEEHRRFLIVLAEMGMQDEAVHQRIVASHVRYTEAIAQMIERAQARGELREGIDAHALALYLKLLVDGLEQGFALGYPIDVERLIPTAMQMIALGLRPDP